MPCIAEAKLDQKSKQTAANRGEVEARTASTPCSLMSGQVAEGEIIVWYKIGHNRYFTGKNGRKNVMRNWTDTGWQVNAVVNHIKDKQINQGCNSTNKSKGEEALKQTCTPACIIIYNIK